MRLTLGLVALAALATLIAVSVWASSQVGIDTAIRSLLRAPGDGGHPWLIATLFDAYFGFLWFWLWASYTLHRWSSRLIWLIAILSLGNIAMAVFVLWRLIRLPPDAGVEDFLLRR